MNRALVKIVGGSVVVVGLSLMGCVDADMKTSVPVKADVKAEAKLLDKSNEGKTKTNTDIKAGGNVTNISPTLSLMGADSMLIAAAVGVVALFVVGRYWLRNRKALGVMIKAVEDLPDASAATVKAQIAKSAYESGLSQDIYNRVQREVKRSLKAQ